MEKKSNVGNGRSKSDDPTRGFGANGNDQGKRGERRIHHREAQVLHKYRYTRCRTCPSVELHRVLRSTPTRRSCWEALHDQLKATQQKRGEHPNDKVAFYEAPTLFRPSPVLPEPSAVNRILTELSLPSGLRHVLLCRVILGAAEVVVRGSRQSQPSSHSFDSAVDNQNTPTRYIIWHPDAQTPLYVPSIKVDFRTRDTQFLP
ncbi:unnamed protein product [Musa textilis]